MSLPNEQKALVIEEGQKLKIVKSPVPELKADHEILVKVEVAAQNPTDWKHLIHGWAAPGKVLGCDIAGTIVEAKDKSLIGKRVAACVHGGWEVGNGAYQEYVKVDKELIIPIPDNISFEAAATLPLATITAGLGIFEKLGFPFPGQGEKKVPFLVWGGASSVGQYAIQYANLVGATVIATASKQNHELLKSLGAAYTVSYKDPDVIEQIKKAAGGPVEYGFDCVSEVATVKQAYPAYKPDGKLVELIPIDKTKTGDTLQHFHVFMYYIFNHDFDSEAGTLKADPHIHAVAAKIYKVTGELLAAGKFKPNPVTKYTGGLAAVEKGFKDQQQGKIRGEKIVYVISETP